MDRLKSKRERALWYAAHRGIGLKQLLLYRGFMQHADEPLINVRRARAIAYALDHYPVALREDDLLVGRYAPRELTEQEAEELRRLRNAVRPEYRLRFGPADGGTGGHRVIDWEKLLSRGVRGVLDEIATRDATAETEDERAFYRASRIAMEALLRFADRYRQAVADAARGAQRDSCRESLTRLGAMLQRVPEHPARTFHEALQSVWLVQFATGFDDTSCTGRPDNYLYPYYTRGLAEGTLTRAWALRLIEELYLRSNEVYADWPETIMLGGTDRQGEPVLNELTTLFIEAIRTVGLVNPNVGLCYRETMPDELLMQAVDCIARGHSHPALYNDAVIVEGLRLAGLAPEDARYYINSTCVEITPIACSNVQVSQPVLYPVKALELVLNKGRQILPDDQYLPREVGEETLAGWARPLDEGGLAVELAALDSFEAFMAVYWRALAEVMGAAVAGALAEAERLARYGASPLVSPLINDCLARGRDAAQGGARDNDWDTMVVGFSTAVDSLNGIRQAVYGEGVVSLSDLRDTLRDDFAQREPLRQYLRNRCNKYGNDDPKADAMAVELYDAIRRELARYETCLGGRFHIGVFAGWGGQPHGAHINRGLVTAATPDGRHAGEPLSECIAPAAGAARSGLTAMMRSVTRMDHRYGLGGISVNVRLDPSVLRHAADREKLVALLRAFMRQGAFEVQMTAVDDETLREAQRHPEAYCTLTVRVAGYSDYFWHLDERLQEEIIQRTAHELR